MPSTSLPPPPPIRSPLLSLKIVWLNVQFWTIAPIFSIVFGALATIYINLHYLVRRDKRRKSRLIRRSLSRFASVVIRCGWPLVRVRYVDLEPGATSPFVFVANHRSSSDGFLMSLLPYECVQVVNIWPSRVPIMGGLVRVAGYLKVREMSHEDFVRDGAQRLGDGCSVIAFPEGTRSGSRTMGPFHGSAFRLAQATGMPIAPLAIAGNEHIPPRGSAILRPGTIVVTKLPAITKDKFTNESPFQLKNDVRGTIQVYLDNLEKVSSGPSPGTPGEAG